jgi:hypothetical protein
MMLGKLKTIKLIKLIKVNWKLYSRHLTKNRPLSMLLSQKLKLVKVVRLLVVVVQLPSS